jgi:acetyl esterase
MGDVFDSSYATDAAARRDRLVSPAASTDTADLTGIAPAVVIAAQNDILRDEDGRYADRLESHGALVAFRVVAGADHGYDLKDDPRAREIYPWIAEHVAVAAAPGIA